jgi:signal transduction histidine kinase
MLLISKTEAGIDRLLREEIDLAGLIREAGDLFAASAEDQGLSLECVSRREARITGDARMIQQMISSLLDNDIKYTPRGGPSPSRFRKRRTGYPFRSAIRARASPQPIFRISSSDSTGTIVRAHGGTITVKSALDKGSTFNMTFPKSRPSRMIRYGSLKISPQAESLT